MTIKKMVQSTDPSLRKVSREVTHFDDSLQTLLQDLEDTLYHEEASAICAPQIGVNQRVAIVDMELEGLLQLINPEIVKASDKKVTDLEGSISLPNVFGEVERSQMIVVQSQDANGNTVELTAYDDIARMIAHIIDQLNGVLFTEKAKRILSNEEVEAYFENE